MYRTFSIIILTLFIFFDLKAQNVLETKIVEKDTLPFINLPAINIIGYPDGYSKREIRRRNRLEYNVRKAYPYAKMAAIKIGEIEQKVAALNRRDEKEFIREEYKKLMETFRKPLMKLTISQGKILIKLIYRETQNTSFSHIKEYKGSTNAFFWQTLARLFGHNLKSTYDPDGEDLLIEEIVKQIESGN